MKKLVIAFAAAFLAGGFFLSAQTSSGRLIPAQKGGKCGYVDKTGKTVIPFKFDTVEEFSDGLALVSVDGLYGYIDETGEIVVPFKLLSRGYTPYAFFGPRSFSEGLAQVFGSLDDAVGHCFIDKTGKPAVLLDDKDYVVLGSFSEGLVPYGIMNTNMDSYSLYIWGYMDRNCKGVIPAVYTQALDFSEGLACVRKEFADYEQWGFIDKTGKAVIPFVYDRAQSFSDGLAPVLKNGKWGYVDKTGKLVIPCMYNEAGCFSEGLARVAKEDGYSLKWGYIDKTGELVISYKFDHAYDFRDGVAVVSTEDEYGLVDKTGKVVFFDQFDQMGVVGEEADI